MATSGIAVRTGTASAAVPSPTWTLCANEGQSCTFTGTKQVRYGANGIYTTRRVTGGVGCSNAEFGDPMYGVVKHCDVADLPCNSQMIGNPDFENGTASWGVDNVLIANARPHSGSRDAWLGGLAYPDTKTLSQTITIPAGCTHETLSFWLLNDSREDSQAEYDTLTVKLGRGVNARYSNLDAEGAYRQHTIDVGYLAGQTVTLEFTSYVDTVNPTNFFIDDVTLTTA
jgi:hypothetical protein